MKIMISGNIVFEAHFRNFLFHEKVLYILKIYSMARWHVILFYDFK